jgi:hypothetical protein
VRPAWPAVTVQKDRRNTTTEPASLCVPPVFLIAARCAGWSHPVIGVSHTEGWATKDDFTSLPINLRTSSVSSCRSGLRDQQVLDFKGDFGIGSVL